MPALSPTTIHAIYTRAISEELGLVIFTNNPIYLTQVLYDYRTKHGEAAFRDIAIVKPGTGDRIFLARKSVELEA